MGRQARVVKAKQIRKPEKMEFEFQLQLREKSGLMGIELALSLEPAK